MTKIESPHLLLRVFIEVVCLIVYISFRILSKTLPNVYHKHIKKKHHMFKIEIRNNVEENGMNGGYLNKPYAENKRKRAFCLMKKLFLSLSKILYAYALQSIQTNLQSHHHI